MDTPIQQINIKRAVTKGRFNEIFEVLDSLGERFYSPPEAILAMLRESSLYQETLASVQSASPEPHAV